jgi:hypothetical protein
VGKNKKEIVSFLMTDKTSLIAIIYKCVTIVKEDNKKIKVFFIRIQGDGHQ